MITTVLTITGIGVTAFVGEKILQKLGREDLRLTLNVVVFTGSIIIILYEAHRAIETVMKVWL